MELVIRHQTIYHYSQPASRVALLLRLKPTVCDGQQLLHWQVTVNGEPVEAFPPNAYGDGEAYFQQPGPVSEIVVVAAGIVATLDRQGILSGQRAEPPLPVFLRQTPLTRPDAAILALADTLCGEGDIARLHALSDRVREAVAYRPGTTSTAFTAAQALAQGQGVCQDHAHLFVSAARTLGVPARYVAGYLLDSEDGSLLRETHGWAEAWVEGLGWVGFDPTNGICTTEQYVRLCCGLDAHDAAPVRGSVFGAANSAMDVDVRISEAGLDPQQIQQQQ
jgi:transglutaminase-like putative cysteine protease